MIHDMLTNWNRSVPEKVATYYQEQNGMGVAVGQMSRVINFIKKNPTPNRQVAINELMT